MPTFQSTIPHSAMSVKKPAAETDCGIRSTRSLTRSIFQTVYNAAISPHHDVLVGLDRVTNDLYVHRVVDARAELDGRTDRYEAKVVKLSGTAFRLVVHYGMADAPVEEADCSLVAAEARETTLRCAGHETTTITFNASQLGRLVFRGHELSCWKPSPHSGFLDCIEPERQGPQ